MKRPFKARGWTENFIVRRFFAKTYTRTAPMSDLDEEFVRLSDLGKDTGIRGVLVEMIIQESGGALQITQRYLQ